MFIMVNPLAPRPLMRAYRCASPESLKRKLAPWDKALGVVNARKKHWLNAFQMKIRRPANMQVGVQRAQAVVGHQNLHLAHRKVLDVFLVGAGFPDFRLTPEPDFLIFFLKNPRPLNGQSAPLPRNTRARLSENIGQFLRRGCASA